MLVLVARQVGIASHPALVVNAAVAVAFGSAQSAQIDDSVMSRRCALRLSLHKRRQAYQDCGKESDHEHCRSAIFHDEFPP